MDKEKEAQSGSRKRTVQESDLNITSEIQAKQRRMATDQNTAPSTSNEFIDLSATINQRRAQNTVTIANIPSAERVNAAVGVNNPQVRVQNVEEIPRMQIASEQRMKTLVQEEMSEIRRSILDLSKVVKELSLSRSQASNSVESRQDIQSNDVTRNNNQTHDEFSRVECHIASNDRYTMGSNGQPNNRNSNGDKISIRVDKWGIVFNGNNNQLNIDDFIFRIEHLQAHYDVSWDEILRDFHLLVAGPAKDWYWLLVKTHGNLRWPTLKSELLNQYQTKTSNFEIIRDLVERKQLPHESIDTFFYEMCKLRSRLIQPIPEYDMIKIMKKNVRESVARIVYPISVSSVEQLRMECQEAERNFPRKDIRSNFPQQRTTKLVNEVVYENIEGEPEVEEIAAAQAVNQKQLLTCWNCKLPGHGFRDCDASERSLFCYRCGKPNVIAPKCPDCMQGNRPRGVGVTGDLRPAKNPHQKTN